MLNVQDKICIMYIWHIYICAMFVSIAISLNIYTHINSQIILVKGKDDYLKDTIIYQVCSVLI